MLACLGHWLRLCDPEILQILGLIDLNSIPTLLPYGVVLIDDHEGIPPVIASVQGSSSVIESPRRLLFLLRASPETSH